jgi:DNA-binding winged helix-turn-helix (wHTH) protein
VRFRFGDVIVDADSRQVLRAGEAVHVSPKAFDLLVTLVRERPRALSKADLHARLWPKTFVSDTSLAMLVAEVRAALGEDARGPGAVRTVHRHGYAFQAEARELPAAGPGEHAAPAADGSAPPCCLVGATRQFPLLRGDNIVGREPGSRVWLDVPGVSRRHARITLDVDRTTLEDLGSKNGTWVGDARVAAPVLLADGDHLKFGAVVVTFRVWSADLTLTEGGP